MIMTVADSIVSIGSIIRYYQDEDVNFVDLKVVSFEKDLLQIHFAICNASDDQKHLIGLLQTRKYDTVYYEIADEICYVLDPDESSLFEIET